MPRVAWPGGRLHQKRLSTPPVRRRAKPHVLGRPRGNPNPRSTSGHQLSVPIRLAAQTIGIRAGRRESRETAGPRARLARDRVRLLRRRSIAPSHRKGTGGKCQPHWSRHRRKRPPLRAVGHARSGIVPGIPCRSRFGTLEQSTGRGGGQPLNPRCNAFHQPNPSNLAWLRWWHP